MNKNDYANLGLLKPVDQVKFVICNREDYQWARMQLDLHQVGKRVGDVLFSPSYGELDPQQLAEWILADNLQVRMQLQLHKLLWQDAAGH
jgi:7-carboxy-7-deazaguanine synthase